jgi:putative endonuclease
MAKSYWVYILTDKPYGTLYIGVTNNLARRVYEHQNGIFDGFSNKYGLEQLVYYEEYADPLSAIAREKALKKWHRDWKVRLIQQLNPTWENLAQHF